METLADRVAAKLKATGKNAKEASTEAGLSATYVRDLIKYNPVSPRMDHLRRLAEVLNTTAEELLYGPDTQAARAAEMFSLYRRMHDDLQAKMLWVFRAILAADNTPDEVQFPCQANQITTGGARQRTHDPGERSVRRTRSRA